MYGVALSLPTELSETSPGKAGVRADLPPWPCPHGRAPMACPLILPWLGLGLGLGLSEISPGKAGVRAGLPAHLGLVQNRL